MTLRLRALSLAAPVAALLLVGTAVPASATVSVYPDSITSDSDPDLIQPSCSGGFLASTGTGTTGNACAGIVALDISANEGADTVDLSQLTATAFPALKGVTIRLGDDFDEDTATGSPFDDSFTGNEGRDDSATGGAGHDTFNGVASAVGGQGDDVFLQAYDYASGGPGDDRFLQFTASSGIEGGEGFDTWEADFDQLGTGSLPAGVTFTMGPDGLTLAVGAVTQPVSITGIERVELTLMRMAPDIWQGATFAGSQSVRGFSGNDALTSGAFADELSGGLGDDTLTGGGGADVLNGGDGNDAINARDEVADQIDCGAGTDSVVADVLDVIVNCETIDRPALPTPPTPPTPPAPPAQVIQVPVVPVTNTVTGPAKVKKGKTGSFTFSSPTAGVTFQCQLDNSAWKACASAYKVKTKKLKLGKHTLLVRALVSGAADATPSKKTFKVVKG